MNKKSSGFDSKFIKTSSKQFPLQDVPYKRLSEQKKEVIKKLLYLFVYYASKGSKLSYYELQEHYFMELIGELFSAAGKPIQKNKGPWKDLQLLYYSKGCQNSLSFKNFLELLPSLAIYAEPDMNREEALKSLMYHLINVYESKVLPDIQGKVINFKDPIEQNTREFISKLAGDLSKLYKLYFPHEVNHKCKEKKFKERSLQSYMEFLKDFEVYPKLISARDIFYIYNEGCQAIPSELLSENQELKNAISQLGETFKFSKFVESLIIISKRVFPKLKEIQNEQEWQKEQKYLLRTLLQCMQTAKTTNMKKTKFTNERFCFIVLDEHPEQVMMKTIQVHDKIIKEPLEDMKFFTLMGKLKF